MACFFTDCSFKGIGELPKVLLVHQRCQRHWQCMHFRCLTPAKTCFAGVIDTGEVGDICCPVSMTPVMHDITGVNDPGDMLRRCQWHQQIHASPVSMTPVSSFLPVLLTPVKRSKTVKVSLPVLLTLVRNYSPLSMTPAKHRNNQISMRTIKINQNRF